MKVYRLPVAVSLFLAVLCVPALSQTCDGRPPNFIVVMVDDLGYHDLGVQGSKDVQSPHIDQLMRDGCIFSEGYSVAGFCSPARAGFITGIHPYHSGHQKNPVRDAKDTKSGLPVNLEIIPQTLKTKGYVSAMIGKWHLGTFAAAHPLRRGFDYFMGFLGSGFPYFEWRIWHKKEREYIFEDYEVFKDVKYLTDDFTDATLRFINKNRANPFFVFLAYNAVHGPYDYLKRDVPKGVTEDREPHVAMIAAVDRGIGRIRKKLENLALTECTVIIFTNDNGGHANGAVNKPLREYKGKLYEGGLRVPLSITYPGVIKSGQVSTQLASLIDIYPTMEAIAEIPHAERNSAIEGVNLYPYICRVGQNRSPRSGLARRAIFNRKPKKGVARKGKWKLWLDTRRTGGTWPRPTALFDLENDVGEKVNLLEQRPKTAAELRRLYMQWDKLTVPAIFSGKGRPNPISLKWKVYPTNNRLRINKEYIFSAGYSHENDVELGSVHWELFEPSAIFKADYNTLPIPGKFKVGSPNALTTTIMFRKPGTYVVRVNTKTREWLNWQDLTVKVKS